MHFPTFISLPGCLYPNIYMIDIKHILTTTQHLRKIWLSRHGAWGGEALPMGLIHPWDSEQHLLRLLGHCRTPPYASAKGGHDQSVLVCWIEHHPLNVGKGQIFEGFPCFSIIT